MIVCRGFRPQACPPCLVVVGNAPCAAAHCCSTLPAVSAHLHGRLQPSQTGVLFVRPQVQAGDRLDPRDCRVSVAAYQNHTGYRYYRLLGFKDVPRCALNHYTPASRLTHMIVCILGAARFTASRPKLHRMRRSSRTVTPPGSRALSPQLRPHLQRLDSLHSLLQL